MNDQASRERRVLKAHRKTIGLALTAACALGASSSASADTDLDVMFIGDSLTWGMTYTDANGNGFNNLQSNGGFRSPLLTGLNSNSELSQFNFNAIGNKGNGVLSTFSDSSVEYRHATSNSYFPDANGDGFDGPSDSVALHSGYSAWVIDAQAYGGLAAMQADNNRGGIRDIVGNTAQNQINPSNANVIMLKIGVNDLNRFAGGSSPYASVGAIVDQLELLIDDIVALAPSDATLVVSTVLPVVENRTPYNSSNQPTDPNNTVIDDFNALLLSDAFGGAFQDDSLGADTWAQHNIHENVILVDANSAIDRTLVPNDAGDLHTRFDDFLHLTPTGYANLSDYYEDRFVALQIPEPSSAALLAVLGGLAMVRRRRSA